MQSFVTVYRRRHRVHAMTNELPDVRAVFGNEAEYDVTVHFAAAQVDGFDDGAKVQEQRLAQLDRPFGRVEADFRFGEP